MLKDDIKNFFDYFEILCLTWTIKSLYFKYGIISFKNIRFTGYKL